MYNMGSNFNISILRIDTRQGENVTGQTVRHGSTLLICKLIVIVV